MHEYALVEELVRRIEVEVREHPEGAVRRVELSVGRLSGVDPGLFEQAFAMLRPGTRCAEAELIVHERPARWTCPGCHRELGNGAPLRCAACDRPARLEPGGDALTLDRIELEVPHVRDVRVR